MTQVDSFSGSVPNSYDQGLGPMLFEPYARNLVDRARMGRGVSVLEVSAGTGLATRELLRALPSDARLTVTDLNEAMLAVAKPRLADDSRVDCRRTPPPCRSPTPASTRSTPFYRNESEHACRSYRDNSRYGNKDTESS